MELIGITTGKAQYDRVTRSLCKTSKNKTVDFRHVLKKKYKNLPADCVPIFGHLVKPRGKIFARLYRSEHKRNFYYIDHGYFFRGHKPSKINNNVWYRISKNGHMQTVLKEGADPSRWEKIFSPHFPVEKYQRTGKHILVCPLGGVIAGVYGQCTEQTWLEDTVAILKANTDREIRVRCKPIIKHGKRTGSRTPLNEDLKDCFAVVTHSSTVSLHAQLKGIPSFCDKTCCARPVSHTDFSLIETPIYDSDLRQEWLHTLAWSQFSLKEYSNMVAYNHIRNHMYDGP